MIFQYWLPDKSIQDETGWHKMPAWVSSCFIHQLWTDIFCHFLACSNCAKIILTIFFQTDGDAAGNFCPSVLDYWRAIVKVTICKYHKSN